MNNVRRYSNNAVVFPISQLKLLWCSAWRMHGELRKPHWIVLCSFGWLIFLQANTMLQANCWPQWFINFHRKCIEKVKYFVVFHKLFFYTVGVLVTMENLWNVQVYTRQIALQIQQPFHNKFVVCCVIFLLSQRGQRAFFEGNDHSIGIAYSLPASIIRIFLQRNDTSPRLPTKAIQWYQRRPDA